MIPLILAVVAWFVACENPLSPELCGAIPDQTIAVGETVELQACFEDPNGESLDLAASSSDAGVATVLVRGSAVAVTAVYPGTASVTVVATDPTGLTAQQSFRVVVPDRAPVAAGTMDDRELMVGDSAAVDVATYFSEPDGQALGYSVAVSEPSRLLVSVQGAVVTMVAVAKGTVVVTVTATDPGGLAATQSFRVTVPNRPPVAVDSMVAREVMVGGEDTVDVAAFFTDPDGDSLTYTAAVSNGVVAAVAVSGSALTLTGLARGETMVTVTATDDEGSFATQSFRVTVPNRPPVVADTIAARTIFRHEADTVALAPYFSDPDGDALTWSATGSDDGVVAVEVSASVGALVVTALSQGVAAVTVTAIDDEGLSAEQSFRVAVPNRAPVVTDTIPAGTTFKNEPDTLVLAHHFSDPDGDRLTWGAETSDGGVVALTLLSGDTLVVTGLSEGEAVVTVTATDAGGLAARQSFAVTVPNREPVASDTIPAQTLYKRESVPIDLARHFTDPDADALEYAIVSTDTLVATATVTGTTITVRAGVRGEATLTVTATDPKGLSARQSFAVTVLNRAPAVTTPIPAQAIHRLETRTLSMSAHFGDADADTLSYRAVSSNPWVVRVRVDGSDVTLTAWSTGEVEITITATDTDGLSAEQTFSVTVRNRAPVAAGKFPDLELGRGDRITLPIARYFHDPDRDDLVYEASTSDPGIATARTSGASVTLRGIADGHAILTLTATDPDSLSATQTSRITVAGQGNTPTPVRDIPGQTIAEGADRTLVVSGYFEDPNGDPLTYSATTGDPEVATASASGARVTISGISSGRTTLTVTATDPDDHSATLRTPVTVVARGQGPVAAAPVPDQSTVVGRTRTVSVANHFQDPDGGSLTFAAASSDAGIVTAAASGSDISLTGVSEGRATVTVTATDPEGLSVRQTFSVQVVARGRAPVAVGVLPAQSLDEGGVAVLDVAPYFRDPEGNDLTYDAGTQDPTIATASATGGTVTVRGIAPGETTLTVTATEPGGLSATQSTEVEVAAPPPGPETVGRIPSDSIMVGDTLLIDVAAYFTHPNGSPLTYTAGTAHSGIAAVAMRGTTARITGRGRGSVTIWIIATDPDHQTAVQRFTLKVSRIDTGFFIDVGYHSVVSDATRTAVGQAVARWQSILSRTEFPDILFSNPVSCPTLRFTLDLDIAEVDDIGLAVVETPVDGSGGLLGYANLCAARTSGHTAVGIIVIDADNVASMEQDGNLEDLVTHEIGHVLGIGIGDAWHDLVVDTVGIPNFTGARATAAYDAAGGSSTTYPYPKVPLDFSASHWREVPFGDELMTPNLAIGTRMPLSAITIQALADIGYTVNVGLAEPYSVPSAHLTADIAGERPAIDLSDDIERGPILVVDSDGNVIRVAGNTATQLPADRPVYHVTIGGEPSPRLKPGYEDPR